MAKRTLKVDLKNSKKRSAVEDVFAVQLHQAGIKDFRRNARFIPGRRFEADLYWPKLRLVVEVDGGLWMPRGGHTSGSGAKRDRERDILAYISGQVLTVRVASDHVRSGEALDWIKQILEIRHKELYGDSTEDCVCLPRNSQDGSGSASD
jgi:very-short-patch-repair endonuclease